ncbi:MAG: hypothetical protein AAF982_05770, partial [Pseudomonadota bacterium]
MFALSSLRFAAAFVFLMSCALFIGKHAATAQTLPAISFAEQPSDAQDFQPLLDVLEDPARRERLIETLRNTASEAGITSATETNGPEGQALAARLATATIRIFEDVFDQAGQVVRDIGRLRLLPNQLTEERLTRIRSEGIELLLTILVTVGIYRTMRILSRRFQLRTRRENATRTALFRTFLGQFGLRILAVLIAWVGGFGLAVLVFNTGEMALSQALYLNAFLVFGLFSVGLSVLVSRHPQDLTFARLPARAEATIYRNVRRTFGIFFYGLIAAVPITQDWTNFVIARSVRTTLVTVGALFAVWAVTRISRMLQRAGADAASPRDGADPPESRAAGAMGLRHRVWPPLAYLYIAVAYATAIANPNLIV